MSDRLIKNTMTRREMVKISGLGIGAIALAGYGPCGVSKEKAVRYCGLAIGYLKDVSPILISLGQQQVVDLINKAIPALEKLKTALENNDFPQAGNLFDTITGILGGIANAVAQLPDNPKKLTIIGIITLVQISMRVISAAVQSETPTPVVALPAGVRNAGAPNPIRRAFDATRF